MLFDYYCSTRPMQTRRVVPTKRHYTSLRFHLGRSRLCDSSWNMEQTWMQDLGSLTPHSGQLRYMVVTILCKLCWSIVKKENKAWQVHDNLYPSSRMSYFIHVIYLVLHNWTLSLPRHHPRLFGATTSKF